MQTEPKVAKCAQDGARCAYIDVSGHLRVFDLSDIVVVAQLVLGLGSATQPINALNR